jgi:Fur family transcriptional regulator, ferric uptake regulator
MSGTVEQLLHEHHLRVTSARRAILEELFLRQEHVHPDTLLEELHKQGKKVSRATLYRTLSLLIDKGLMRKIHLGDGNVDYDPNYGIAEHDHLICLKCGKTIEFRDEMLRSREQEICSKLQFQPVRRSVKIFGYCSDPAHCTAEESRPASNPIHELPETD